MTGKNPLDLFNAIFHNGMDELTLTDSAYSLRILLNKILPTKTDKRQFFSESSPLSAHFPEIWEGILKLTWIKQLKIIGIPLANVPASINQLKELRGLILSNNQLTAPLPETISTLPYLEHLVVSENNLTSLPLTLIHAKQLKYVSFRGNQITELPENFAYELSTLPHLTVFNLTDNTLNNIPYTFYRKHL